MATNAVEPVDVVDAPVEPPRYTQRGKCDTGRPLCGKTARWTAAGWRCDEHRPSSH
jgi:hypothetical protein